MNKEGAIGGGEHPSLIDIFHYGRMRGIETAKSIYIFRMNRIV